MDLVDTMKSEPKKVKLIDGYEKIAAGEVIERPASVVKELVENSIDAGSTQITIIIKEYGKELIQVIDNGSGINKDDIELAFQAHTSSKIDCAEDLNQLNTLGFRGEALFSISSISKIELITKTESDEMGVKCEIENKKKVLVESIAATRGTNIKIKDIFYNTPVRYKFLKSDRVEMGHITDIVTRLVLCYPQIQFKLIHNDIPLINSPATKKDKHINRVFDIYGKKIAKSVKEFSFEDPNFKIHGFLGEPALSRTTTLSSSVFVNNRYVKSPLIQNSMSEAYKDYLMVNKHPFYIVFLDIEPSKVDFNIHPTKQIIRFQNESDLLVLLIRSLTRIINLEFGSIKNSNINEKNLKPDKIQTNLEVQTTSNDIISKISETESKSESINASKYETIGNLGQEGECVNNKHNSDKIKQNTPSRYDIPLDVLYDIKDNQIDTTNFKENKIIVQDHAKNWIDTSGVFPRVRVPNEASQLNKLYFILEGETGFYILDMHAAHERINYEDQLEKFNEGGIKRQKLIFPINFEVPINEKDFILDSLDKLAKYGFELDHMGGNTFAIRTIPANFSNRNSTKFDPDFVINIVQEIVIMGKGTSLDMEFDKIIKYIACHMSLRGGEKVNNPETVKKLLLRLSRCKNPNHCAHGRPVMLEFTYSDIDKMFHR